MKKTKPTNDGPKDAKESPWVHARYLLCDDYECALVDISGLIYTWLSLQGEARNAIAASALLNAVARILDTVNITEPKEPI